jgi:hypothetical protein
MRKVILHYHLFKNAGTSVDAILTDAFPGKWLTTEFESNWNSKEVGGWIAANHDHIVFSSHTAQLPVPRLANTEIIPVIFVRHPLDRIRSSYIFAQKQTFDAPHVHLSRRASLAEYVRIRLDTPRDRQCRNAQTARFGRYRPGRPASELDRALQAVTALPFVGVVECFDESIRKMAVVLQRTFPAFRAVAVRKNVSTEPGTSLAERLELLRREIGDSLYAELTEANMEDIRLHHAAQVQLGLGGS